MQCEPVPPPASKIAKDTYSSAYEKSLVDFTDDGVTIRIPPIKDNAERVEIAKLLIQRQKANTIIMEPAETRNIILLGRSRSGKSTLLRMFKSPTLVAENLNLFAQTKDAVLNVFSVVIDGVNYNINIIDTPGLFERNDAGSDAEVRCNTLIKSMITKCLEFEITYIHTCFFVCSFDSGLIAEDVKAIIELNRLFKGADKVFHLLVTRSEGYTAERRKFIESEIRKVPELEEFFAYQKVQIFFSGIVSHDHIMIMEPDFVKKKIESVMTMRATLYDHICGSSEFAHLSEMDIFKELKREVDAMKDNIDTMLRTLKEKHVNDLERAQVEQRLGELAADLKKVTSSFARVTGQDQQAVYKETLDAAAHVLKLAKPTETS